MDKHYTKDENFGNVIVDYAPVEDKQEMFPLIEKVCRDVPKEKDVELKSLLDKRPQQNNREKGSRRFHQLLYEIGKLHDKKQLDYGNPSDPFANVRSAEDWGLEPWVGAMVRANDKIKRLQKYKKDGTLANEGARDSFMDLACYSIIALTLWEETHENNV